MRLSKTFYRALVSLCFVGLSFQVKAQTSFEFMPAGQLNLIIDEEQSFYLNIGGPTFYLFDSPTSKSGILLAPSLKLKKEESLKVAPANGAGVFWQSKNSGLKLTFLGYYESANEPWNLAFGIGKILKVSKKQ